MKDKDVKMGNRVRITRGAWSGCTGTVIGRRATTIYQWMVYIDPKFNPLKANIPYDADEMDDAMTHETLGAPSALLA